MLTYLQIKGGGVGVLAYRLPVLPPVTPKGGRGGSRRGVGGVAMG